MNLNAFYDTEFDQHEAALDATRKELAEPFARLVGVCTASIRSGNKLVLFGNGGSAADCQHLATELAVRYITDRPPIAAIALTTDTSMLTAIGNDWSFDDLFSRQVEAIGNHGDVAIAISTSGKSENVLRGLAMAKEKGLVPTGLSGKGGGGMSDLCDPFLLVPSDITSRIQEMHITLGHMLCGALEQELGLI
ncbi:MAG TPA: SIS domain-containing protein [Rhodospirillales bacterium]|nr:SIS domain-containing protein [Rhodospirillales bacterium]HIE20799.1 SIS domain-containing protein [Rhodospirillales bacterium]HIM77892.1 SIS domain-containing protein [Rhodospirillales bacterium]